MEYRHKSDTRHAMGRLIPSDLLPHIVELTEAMPALAALRPRVLQMRLVFDANRVHAELRWRLMRRKSPSDRSAIHEAIVAGVVVLFAPEQLKSEIAKYLEDIAEDTGVSVADVQREWDLFQKHLCFYEPKSRPSSAESYADVDDFPYLATSRELDTQAVYTSDRHLAAMQAPVVSSFIDTHLRDYARAKQRSSCAATGIVVFRDCELGVSLRRLSPVYPFYPGTETTPACSTSGPWQESPPLLSLTRRTGKSSLPAGTRSCAPRQQLSFGRRSTI